MEDDGPAGLEDVVEMQQSFFFPCTCTNAPTTLPALAASATHNQRPGRAALYHLPAACLSSLLVYRTR